MKHDIRPLLALSPLLVAAGCASTTAGSSPGTPVAPAASAAEAPREAALVSTLEPATVAEASATPGAEAEAVLTERVAETPAAPRRTGWLSDVEREIWNSPDFRRLLAQSYIADTDVEPRLNEDEAEDLQEMLEHVSKEEFDQALELLAGHDRPSDSAMFNWLRGAIALQQEDFDTAVSSLEVAVQKWPKFRRAWQSLAWVHFNNGDFDQAIPAFTEMLQLGGGDALNYGMLGFAYLNVGNSLSAETALRTAILLDPGTEEWKRGLAQALFEQRRFGDAVALFDTLIAENPSDPEVWAIQGKAYIGLGEIMTGAQNIELAIGLGGRTTENFNLLGNIYVNEGLYDLAVANYSEALALDPASNLGRALQAAKDLSVRNALDETSTMIAKIEEVVGEGLTDEQRTDILRIKARIALAEGASDEEAAILEEIVALNPLDGNALIYLGRHARRNGELELAAHYFQRAAAIEQFEADAKVEHAQLLVEQSRYAEAVPLLERAQALDKRQNVGDFLEKVQRFAAQSGGN